MGCKINTTQHNKEVVIESIRRTQTHEQLGLFVVQGTPEHSHGLVADWLAARA